MRPERNKDARCVFVGLHEEPTVRLDSHPRSARACLAVLSAIFDYALNRTRLTVLALWAKGGSDGVGATPPRKHSTLSPGGVLGRRRINQDREHCKWLQTLLLFSGVAVPRRGFAVDTVRQHAASPTAQCPRYRDAFRRSPKVSRPILSLEVVQFFDKWRRRDNGGTRIHRYDA